MKTMLLMADGASDHRDGPITIFRAGINRALGNPSGPSVFRGTLILLGQITDPTEKGTHTIAIKVVDAHGQEFEGGLAFSKDMTFGEKGNFNFVLNFMMQFPRLGDYEFIATCGGQDNRWPFSLVDNLETKQ